MANYRLNEEKHGVEIFFDSKPAEEIRNRMKAAGFRWGKGYWYAKQNAERIALAEELTSGNKTENAPKTERKPEEKKNKYGIKVGDVFGMSWGYDETHNSYFQVIALVGKESVKVREINPRTVSCEACGPMAEDRVIEITNEILPPSPYSVFIKDNEHGDLKRVQQDTSWNGKTETYIKMDHHWANYCKPGTEMIYESWYH